MTNTDSEPNNATRKMDISSILTPSGVIPALRSGAKKAVLEELAEKAAEVTGRDASEIFSVLLDREKLGSTGVGGGVAIPHGKLNDLDRLYMVFARAQNPIEFDAVDEHPVDLFCMLIAPEEAGADHLKALARISRLLRNQGMCDKLRGAGSADAIYALLTQDEAEQAA